MQSALSTYRRSIILSIIGIFFLLYISGPLTSFAQAVIQAFSVESDPYGISYPTWAAKWWQWIMSIPKADNPALDTSGDKCAMQQNDQNVWFLATTFGGNIQRTCDIPEGKGILVPVLIGMCDTISEPTRQTEAELRDCAWSGINNAVYRLTVDNVEFDNITDYRISSPVFDLTVPVDNAWGNPTGGAQVANAEAVAAGVYVLLKPPSVGAHEIHFSSSIIDNPTLGTFLYAEEINYNVNVVSQ